MRKQVASVLVVALALGACGSKTTKNRALPAPDDSGGGTGQTGGAPGGGPGTGGAPFEIACPGPVQCASSTVAAYCTANDQSATVVCAKGMAVEGIDSKGCVSDAQSDGCSIDGFLDADCENGAPPFAVCAELTDADLIDVYTACYKDLAGAQAVVACYGGFVSDDQTLVDCMGAEAVCYP